MKNLFYAALFLFPAFISSQVGFEPGYIINESGEKLNVLLKNYDWKNSPNSIEYKLNKNDKPIQLKTLNVKEFFVGNIKYFKAKTMIDRSSTNLQNLSETKEFNSKEEILLLKTLVEGKISLYKYSDGNITRYFYKRENSEIISPLEYKEYLDYNKIEKNEKYKNQLKQEFSDNEKITASDIERLVYKENNLKNIFILYNGLDPITDEGKNKNFHIYLKPGIGFSNYKILPLVDDHTTSEYKKSNILYRFGIELEYVLNFNKGKWAIISEPTFQTVNITANDYNRRNFEIKYSSIQIPLGFKYNMFLNQKSKLYLSASFYYDLILNNDVFNVDNTSAKAQGKTHPSFAAGYYYDKFGLELKWGAVPSFSSLYYGKPKDISMNGFNVSVSYKLF
ncbi:outer membrane protein with beta-barrel domain [Chryseobacterium sp. 52]|uniref:outer membrane beta-barrel protein n=1 Tax=Chryseobacterium sp. 52 TaxID=2035213 RepID=UPI000C179478|nr:outer membrane beta-barrel protein [Chryseobacterium sp. 52]PIF46846.1 outer membrane protein with beta-barrel domain [Chryseobacterium sp. 52]